VTPAPSRPFRGYILLAMLLVVAALVLLVAVAQQRAGDSRAIANFERGDAQARALAEAGLERTRAFLGTLIEREGDLDRALDPGMNTDCFRLPRLEGITSDDHLPPFTGTRVVVSSSGKAYTRVLANPIDEGEGAYFVRVDDNDDDAQGGPGLESSTSNNPTGNCLEGPSLGPARNNPVRDRDGMVWVTVIGVAPGASLEGNASRHTLRVLVGPGEPAGIIAGGKVRMQGAAHVCGPFGDVVATGSIEGGCLCGARCSSGSVWNSCGAGNACVGLSGGDTCSASSGRAGGECAAGVQVPAPPRASSWDVIHAPLGCTGPPCLPFYYLRLDAQAGSLQASVYGWNYSACASPRAGPRICSPSECATCWAQLNATRDDLDIHLSDLDLGLRGPAPSTTISSRRAPLVWRANGTTGFTSGGMGCDTGDTGVYPGTLGFNRRDTRNVTFEYMADPSLPEPARLPRGVWFVEGNIRFRGFQTPPCEDLAGDPGYRTTLIATGSILHEAGPLSFRPASAKGVVMLAGRDLIVRGGSARIHTCGASAVVMAHEQVIMGGDAHLEGQLVAENASTCSDTVDGEAVQMSGSATVSVPSVPPLPVGPPARARLLSESAH
jgi:hypothetical protein